jgi:hypothetical protein
MPNGSNKSFLKPPEERLKPNSSNKSFLKPPEERLKPNGSNKSFLKPPEEGTQIPAGFRKAPCGSHTALQYREGSSPLKQAGSGKYMEILKHLQGGN